MVLLGNKGLGDHIHPYANFGILTLGLMNLNVGSLSLTLSYYPHNLLRVWCVNKSGSIQCMGPAISLPL